MRIRADKADTTRHVVKGVLERDILDSFMRKLFKICLSEDEMV
jgi:hypothetical protein